MHKNANNIFYFKDYRKIVKNLVFHRNQIGDKLTYQKLAEMIGVQKSYLSQVLAGRAHFSADQIYLLCEAFHLDSEQQTYLQLLLDYEKSGVSKRKSQLAERIKKMQSEKQSPEKQLEAPEVRFESFSDEYFINAMIQKVHLGLEIEHFSQNPQDLRAQLGLSTERFTSIIETLQRMGLVEYRNGRYKARNTHYNLSKESPIYQAWVSQQRTLFFQRYLQLSTQQAFTYTVTFSATEATRQELEKQFMDFLKSAEKSVIGAPAKRLYQMNFDLMPWTE